jgi:hypothetical protein
VVACGTVQAPRRRQQAVEAQKVGELSHRRRSYPTALTAKRNCAVKLICVPEDDADTEPLAA